MISTRKPPKDHKLVEKHVCSAIDVDAEPVHEFMLRFANATQGILNPMVEVDLGWADEDSVDFYVSGFEPMTEKEIQIAKQKNKRRRESRKAAREKAIEEEKKQALEYLKKYPDLLENLNES